MKLINAEQSLGTIAILTDQYIDYPKLVIDTISSILNDRGYGTLCIAGRELSQNQAEDTARSACNAIFSLANAKQIKGLISISGSIGHSVDEATLEKFLAQFNVPIICLNDSSFGLPSVLIDELSGMRQLMRHLLNDDTRQRVAYIRGYTNDPHSLRRENVFREVMKESGRVIDESLFIKGNYDKFETYNAVSEFLESKKTVDAMVAANDLMALSAARAISAKGLRIPQDIAVTGYDDTTEATQNSPALTTVRQPIDEIAKKCAYLLLDTIDSFETEADSINASVSKTLIVENELIVRGSTMAIPRRVASKSKCEKERVCENLEVFLAGLTPPKNLSIHEIAEAYWSSVTTGSHCFANYISRYLNGFISFNNIHWWSNLCHQLEAHTQSLRNDPDVLKFENLVSAVISNVRERIWSVSLDHEFEIHRLEIMQNRMQLRMSFCTNSGELLHVLTDWMEALNAKRSFLAQLETPGHTPSEYSSLIHAYQDGRVKNYPETNFPSKDLLPASLHHELQLGLLILCPVHAGDNLFGYLLFDPSGAEHLDLESTSNCIGIAMHNHYLIQSLEKQTNSLQIANRELNTLAKFDSLTGLPNRLNFQSQIAEQCKISARNCSQFALLFLDLDGFKNINDTLGHDAGDNLLQIVARRLESATSTLPPGQVFIARLGGDEFTIIIDCVDRKQGINQLIDTLLVEIGNAIVLGSQSVTISGSIGCAFYPCDGENPETLVKHADTAMYHAKAQGKNCMSYFNPEMSTEDELFLRLDQEMRMALANYEFRLYYQPKIDLKSGDICSVEALMRWVIDKPSGSQFHSMPDEFIPIAEFTGFIVQLDLYAMDQACWAARQWELNQNPLPVAVNLSVTLLQKDNFVELVSKILEKTQLTASLLELEVTESGLMTNVDVNVGKLEKLQKMGVRVAIDDFGTGYSSLSYLKKLPIDSLKIDRSFISDIESTSDEGSVDVTIVRAIVALGRSLDLNLVAEGVETASQMHMVRRMGCHQAQGYLFARPLPLDELEVLLGNNNEDTKVA